MRTDRLFLAGALSVAGIASISIAAAGIKGGSPGEPRTFRPPRIAVLDVSKLFQGYGKAKDLDDRIKGEIREGQKMLRDLRSRQRKALDDLKNLKAGTKAHRDATLEAKGLEIDLQQLETDLEVKINAEQLAALKELRLDVATDIEKYATGLELDLVLEKTLFADGEKGKVLPWPIVHYARPEIDITDDLIRRLNEQYGK